MPQIILKNGQIVSKDDIKNQDIIIDDGEIKELVNAYKGKDRNKEIIDLKGKFVLPGIIDSHVHFRTPGNEVKEDFMTGSRAAASAGITSILDMPNTTPSTTNLQVLEDKIHLASRQCIVNFGFHFGATNENFDDMQRVKGVASVKVFMGSSTGNLLIDNDKYLEKMFAEVPKLFAVHAEDEKLIQKNIQKYAGDLETPSVHSDIRDQQVAFNAVKKALHLAKKYEHPLHICHVSSEMELQVIKKFKEKYISCEATPHHLFFSLEDYIDKGNLVKMNPPIRSKADQEALWKALTGGLIDIVATDHAPHLKDEKLRRYLEAPSGVPGVETMLPLLLDAVNKGRINLRRVVELTSYNPSKIFGIKKRGRIKEGFAADLTVIDMDLTKEVENKRLYTKCGWSPFNGWVLKGWPVMTYVNGNMVWDGEKVYEEVKGKAVEF